MTLLNIICYPGSGTHLLIDVFSVLEIKHLPLGHLIYKLMISDKTGNIDKTQINDIKTFDRVKNEILKYNFEKDHDKISKIISDIYLDKIENKNYFLIQPNPQYEFFDKTWGKNDILIYNKILKGTVREKGWDYNELFYVRNPHHIYQSRAKRKNWTSQKSEIHEINSFFSLNREKILRKHLKYEELCSKPRESINSILELFYNLNPTNKKNNINELDKVVNSINFHTPLRNYPLQKEIFNKIDYIYTNNYNVIFLPFRKLLIYFKMVFNELKAIHAFIVLENYSNTAIFERHKWTIFGLIFKKILKIRPRYRKNLEIGLNISNKINRGNKIPSF